MKDDKLKKETDQLKKDIFSDDWDLIKSAAGRLIEIGGDEIVDFFISLLALDNPNIRNMAALALHDLKDNRAVEPLLKAIFKQENHQKNGTMVYALEELDCSTKLKEIFQILFYQTWESKQSAYSILSSQVFTFISDDLLEIKNSWDDIKSYPEKCPGYDDVKTREMIQNAVEGYMEYLNA
ncbi:MAG: HEAT repeat domain-containing protein [Daejeonella sp.]